jgi:hypothetical protein
VYAFLADHRQQLFPPELLADVARQRRHHRRKVLPAAGGIWMVSTEAGLTDRKGALVQAAGAVEVALGAHDDGEVAEALRR